MTRRPTAPRTLPSLTGATSRRRHPAEGVLFAVYAPFGGDPALARFPDGVRRSIQQLPLLRHLKAVAAQGANVAALIDLPDDDSWLVEIPAFQPGQALVLSAWKQDMARPEALAGFLRRAHARFPCASLVLALEGHGAGYLPEVDPLQVTPATTNEPGGASLVWTIGGGASRLQQNDGSPVLPVGGFEVLPVGGFEVLPAQSPEALPAGLPLSSWGLATALHKAQKAGVPRAGVIHFNNCFNMALEHLHAVAPHADAATGYANYNYFTGGSTYPAVFKRLRLAGAVSPLTLARWFAEENHRPLLAKGNHPGVGAAIGMKQVRQLADAVDRLAQALTAALRADRAQHFPIIRAAVVAALQYDTQGDFQLEVPDQSTDLGQLADRLAQSYPPNSPIHTHATAVLSLLDGAQVYGDADVPRMNEDVRWDFSDRRICISLMVLDPLANGLLDWRAPYYMKGAPNAATAPALKAQVPFLADRPGDVQAPWPEFLREYHNVQPLPAIRLLRIPPLQFPAFDIDFKPNPDGKGHQQGPKGPNDPNGRGGSGSQGD